MKFWLFLSSLLVFGAGVSVGSLLFRDATRGLARGTPTEILTDAPYLFTSEDVYKELNLDGRQRESLDLLVGTHYRRVTEVRDSLQSLSLDLRAGVDNVLLPEQRTRLQEIMYSYRDREIQERVFHRITSLRTDLLLIPEQEPLVYQVLYDAEREGRQAMKDLREKREGREAARETWTRINDKRDARLESILTEEQVAIYRERRARETRWWAEQRDRFKKNGDHGDRGKKRRRPPSGESEDDGGAEKKPSEPPPGGEAQAVPKSSPLHEEPPRLA